MVKVCKWPIIILISLVFFSEPVMSSWDFSVTTNSKIIFYDANWDEKTSAAHQFEQLSAIAFDETDETIYFNDQAHINGSLFSLKLSADDNHRVEKMLQKTRNESIQGIAFDPLGRRLYWTDSENKNIYEMDVDKADTEPPQIWLKFTAGELPQGISIDVCRRKVYWTNSNFRNPTIERASLDGTKRETIIRTGLFMPTGIVVDQFTKRIYWVDDQQGIHYTVESAALDGTDRNVLVRGLDHAPLNLAVDKETVYWTDITQYAVWKVNKNSTNGTPVQVHSYKDRPNGIITRGNLLSSQENNPDCIAIVKKIKETVLAPEKIESPILTSTTPTPTETICLNNGALNRKTGTCICPNEYRGQHCEIPICHNYCIQGTCHITSTGYAQCSCFAGYEGDRCESNVCSTAYCLNGGRCEYEEGGPVCHCIGGFDGWRCEHLNIDLMCERYCEDRIDLDGHDLMKLCGNCSNNSTRKHIALSDSTEGSHNSYTRYTDYRTDGSVEPQQQMCTNNTINKTVIFVCVGVVVSLTLVFLIINAIRRMYKPIRPKIKKTYVVHKNVRSTPLTCRPTTEQCEITIEDCCNMNICDTPCFDPKALQQELNKEPSRKDDKYNLLSNMEGDLY